MPFPLTTEQRAAVEQRGGSLLVSAAAGSGKTRVLVERLLSRVEEGADIDRFLVITFTKAAAAELKSRIAAELAERMALDPQNVRLRRQATLLYKADISTIDAFCTQFLREEGHRLDLDHDFRVCDGNESQVLMDEALDQVLEERYAAVAGESDFTRLVDTLSDGRDDSALVKIVQDVRTRVQSHPDPDGWLRDQERVFALEGASDAGDTPWGRELLDDLRRQAEYWSRRMLEALELCQGDDVLSRAYAPSVQATFNALLSLSRTDSKGWDETRIRLDAVDFPRVGSSAKCEDAAALARVKNIRKRCGERVKKWKSTFADDSAGLLEDMRSVYPAIRGLFSLVQDFEARYTAIKRRRGVLDFSDLEHLTAKLLVGEEVEPTELAKRWGARYDEVMVDEFQDVNATQNAIFTALAGAGSLFTVGDVKQSIYRFRLADPAIFLKKYRDYPMYDRAEGKEERKVLLSQNFRSRPQVLEGCNYLFRSIMSVPFGEMDYTDAEALRPGGTFPVPEDGEDRYALELDLLDCTAEDDAPEDAPKPPRDLLEARFAARRVRKLLDEGLPVSDGEGGLRPVREGDIVILLRTLKNVQGYYISALESQGITCQSEGGESFFDQEEVVIALSLLSILDNLHQDVPLIAALRSPVYGFSADRLAQIRARAPKTDFYTALLSDDGDDVKAFLEEMAALRAQAGEESCDRIIWRLYEETALLGVYGAMPDGEARRANLLMLVQLARDFESAGHKGLFGFLSYLRRLEASEKKIKTPAGGQGGGVRVMSIHNSKGLEFPVALLCGLAREFNTQDLKRPVLFHPELGVGPKRLDLARMVEYPTLAREAVKKKLLQERCAEELRLLYVAMTRAQEKLIMTCALTGGMDAIERLRDQAGSPVEPQALLDCAAPAKWVLLAALARPEAAGLQDPDFPPPVRPDTDFGPRWEINWVDAQSAQTTHSAPQTQARQNAPEAVSREELLKRFSWVYPHSGDVELPSKLTATQLKGRNLDEEAAQEAPPPQRPIRFDRPRFAAERLGLTPTQKGTALHLVMQYIDFAACGSLTEVEGEIARLVEKRFLTPQQAEAVDPEKVLGFFTSPLGREALASQTLRREFKFSILVPAREYWPQAGEGERVLLQGVVDCYFEDADGLTVIDFKTDHVHGEALTLRAQEYRPQLEAYAKALGEITGKRVKRRVLYFFSEGRAVEV